MDTTNSRETTPQPISYWMGKACEKIGKSSSQKELSLYDELLLAVDKSGLNIKGKYPTPEDAAQIVKLLLTLETKNNCTASLNSGLCIIEIKRILVEKLSNVPRGLRHKDWRRVVNTIKNHSILAKKDKRYAQIGNKAALLE